MTLEDKLLTFAESSGHYDAAEDTLKFLMEVWDGNPKRKGAVNDCRKILTRHQLEKERVALATRKAREDIRPVIVRPYKGMEIGRFINDIRPTDREVKSWLKTLGKIFGASTSVATAVVVLAWATVG